MKRNRLLMALVSFMMIFVIAGCSNSTDAGNNAAASNNTGGSANGTGGNRNGSINGFGKPDVYGEVSEIDGNKVTLKLMQIPTMGSQNGQNRGNGQNGSSDQNANNGQNTDNGQNNSNGQNTNGGRGAWRGGGPGGMRARQYTGEEKTITIPDGTALVTITRGQNGMAENNITLKDITVGSTLSVFYKEDGKTIDKIRVMQPRGNGQYNGQSNDQNNGQNNGQSNGQSSNSTI